MLQALLQFLIELSKTSTCLTIAKEKKRIRMPINRACLSCDKVKSVDHERKMRGFLALVLTLILLPAFATLQGCSSTSEYSFAPRALTLEHDCRDIAGVYRNRGDTNDHYAKDSVYLFDKITGEGYFGMHGCGSCSVTLAWIDSDLSELLVTLHYPSGHTLEEVTLKHENDDFTCEDGMVSVGFTQGIEVIIDGYIASGTRKYFLAEDGSLVQEEHFILLGHTLIAIPWGMEYTSYTLWPRAGNNTHSLYRLAMDSDDNRDRIELLCQSAIEGEPYAAAQLGLIYAAGLDGIKPDLVESYKWYGLADRLGQASADDAMLLLKQRMTKGQQSDAMRLLDEITDNSSCETATD
jgi:hypothetical protein